jgi:hypothetical protein
MRYTDLIENIEDVRKQSHSSLWQKTIAGIKKDCQPYLTQIDSDILQYPLYRGMGTAEQPALKKKVRLAGRKPMDTPDNVHSMLNNSFTQLFGAPFRDSMFASGSFHVTNDYGNLYLVFPIGDFEFIWSSDVVDLFSEHGDYLNGISQNTHPTLDSQVVMTEWVHDLGYQNTDLQKAIQSHHELMIRCSGYYAISISLWQDERNYMLRLVDGELKE